MVAVTVSFVTVDWCFVIREGHSRPDAIRVGPGVQPLQSANYTYSCVHG